ncbi:MAG: GNAT family N-acetyltransferase [Chloroflexia bacterium]|nr:GNAT family N-acetyltransferase [Chloroflexia bacterium]
MTEPFPDELTDAPSVVVERFDRSLHDISHFSCGEPSLDAYIHRMLERDELDRTAVAYVLVRRTDAAPVRRVLGYFTLSSYSFSKRQARRRDRDRYLGAYDPVPAILIGRLALDTNYQGRGLGVELLVAALNEALAVSQQLGATAVVVHALHEHAATFYQHHGFTRFRDMLNHLYVPLETFVQGLRA